MRDLCGFLALWLFVASMPKLQAADPAVPGNSASPAIFFSPVRERASGESVAELAAALVVRPIVAPPLRGALHPGFGASELIRQLDDPSFNIRRAAIQQLQRLSREPESASALANQFQRLLCDERTSLEVRVQLVELMRHLPIAPSAPPTLPSANIDHLLSLLDDDSFAVRSGAAERLKWLARNSAMICPLVETIKARLADPTLSPSTRRQIEPLWTKIHGAWLLSDSAGWRFPAVPAKRIDHWIDALEHPASPDGDIRSVGIETASRELLDLMVRPDTAPVVLHALEARLADPQLESTAEARLREIYDWSRPALVAEYWDNNHVNEAIQHLLVGVPSLPPGADFPSYFDHCDNHVAHCVSGNSLSAGDYPVGIALPHPRQPGAFFQLVNLPTTQRRLAYEFQVEEETDARRLAEISVRTLNRILERHEPLDDDNLSLLELLDADEVSKFAGRYFQAVTDGPHDDYMGRFGTPSRHGVLCLWLASHGTHTAIVELTHAIAERRIREPDEKAPFRLPWVAALAIAQHDPWQGEDTWLAQRISCAERLELAGADEVGATAAAQLLERHGQPLRDFGLQEVESEPLNRTLHLKIYRFERSDGRAAVLRWWSRQATLPE